MDDDAGFLARWSRRKAQVRQGLAPQDAAPVPEPAAPAAAPQVPAAEPVVLQPTPAHDEPPAPTLDDVAALPADAADFSRFVAPRVTPEVRNAAMKKLFSDPHFQVMDGLDVYIDDYSQPDPLPEGMLKMLAQSRLLGLVTDEPEAPALPQHNAADEPDAPIALAEAAPVPPQAPDHLEPKPTHDDAAPAA